MNNLKISALNLQNSLSFKQQSDKTELKRTKNFYVAAGAAVTVSAAALLAYRGYNNSYKVKLARDMSKELGEKITTKHLKSVMTKSEMLKDLPKLTEQNYVASPQNLENGVFLADLHSHSNYSDGVISVEDLLNQAAAYGDKLQKLKGKKFIFALSDHDGIDGVKEALKIIVRNPEKYQNIKFIPAAEMSFVMPCQKNSVRFGKFNSDVQMPEMLVYNLNPFSETTKTFFEGIYKRRGAQISQAIEEACSHYNNGYFSTSEYNSFFMNPGKKYCFLNQHWRIWNYLHTKSQVVQMAKEQNAKPDALYEKIVKELKQMRKNVNPDELDEYINRKGIQTKSNKFDEKLKPVLDKIFPKISDKSMAESDFELKLGDIVQYAKKENALLGFAHPGFTMQNFEKEKCISEMQSLIRQGKGRIKFAEKYHQAYPFGDAINRDELNEYHKVLDKLNLIYIGGRDNHTANFIPSNK